MANNEISGQVVSIFLSKFISKQKGNIAIDFYLCPKQ